MKYRLDEGFRQALQSIENSFKNSMKFFIFKFTVDMRLKSTTTKSHKLNLLNCKMKSSTSNIFESENYVNNFISSDDIFV